MTKIFQRASAHGLDADPAADWRERAACSDEDPELFFPVGTTGPALDQAEQAKAVCRRCDVADACLKWALETRQAWGVWGGMTEQERSAHAKAQRLADLQRERYGDPEGWEREQRALPSSEEAERRRRVLIHAMGKVA